MQNLTDAVLADDWRPLGWLKATGSEGDGRVAACQARTRSIELLNLLVLEHTYLLILPVIGMAD